MRVAINLLGELTEENNRQKYLARCAQAERAGVECEKDERARRLLADIHTPDE